MGSTLDHNIEMGKETNVINDINELKRDINEFTSINIITTPLFKSKYRKCGAHICHNYEVNHL